MLTNFISAFRQAKGKVGHASDLLEATFKFKDAAGRIVDTPTGVGSDELPLLLDLFCATDDAQVKGLVNVNTASAAVLRTIQIRVASRNTQIWIICHATRLIAALLEDPNCMHFELQKEFGQTRLVNQSTLEQPPWKWPTR